MSDSPAGAIDWRDLTSFSDTYTCYSAAVATWIAWADPAWASVVNPGLWLTLTDAPGGLFGFSHFPGGLRAGLGLRRTGVDEPGGREAVEGVLDELTRSGRVIVAGDGFNLPWHVAFERRHVPHWFVLAAHPEGPVVVDPFAARNDLGRQEPRCESVEIDQQTRLLAALPDDDPVLRLREALALGDGAGAPDRRESEWYVLGDVGDWHEPVGASGPDAVSRLAAHFRDRGQEVGAYAQADDIWSIARHRAFLARYAEGLAHRHPDEALAAWVQGHAAPLAKKWSHLAPLMMQATLALGAGRTASASVPERLAELAERERVAAQTLPAILHSG